jgi:hypothetical protein
MFVKKVGGFALLMCISTGAISGSEEMKDVDNIRMPPKITSRYGSMIDPQAPFNTWVNSVMYLEDALSEFGQKALRLKGLQLITGPELGLLVSKHIRIAIPPYSPEKNRSESYVAEQTISVSKSKKASTDDHFEFEGVKYSFDEETRSIFHLDLSFSLGYNLNTFQSADEWLNEYGINILPSTIDLEKEETERITFQLPFAIKSDSGGFRIGSLLEADMQMAVRTKTSFQRKGSTLGMYNEVTLRADIDRNQEKVYQVMSRFNFLTQIHNTEDPLSLSGPIHARFCMKDAAILLPTNAINLRYGGWVNTGLSYLPDIQAGMSDLKNIFSQHPMSLDVFFPLAEQFANERLSDLPNVSVLLDAELEYIPGEYRCDRYVSHQLSNVIQKLNIEKYNYYQRESERGYLSRILEDEAGLLGTIKDVSFEAKKRLDQRLNQVALTTGQKIKDTSVSVLHYLKNKAGSFFGE